MQYVNTRNLFFDYTFLTAFQLGDLYLNAIPFLKTMQDIILPCTSRLLQQLVKLFLFFGIVLSKLFEYK